jgi:hypothetical protein
MPRWSLDTTFQVCREDLPRESTPGDGQHPVRRWAPGLLALYPPVVLLYRQRPRSSAPFRATGWRGTSPGTFSEMLTCVRRALWEQWCVHTPAQAQECSYLFPSFQDMSRYALASAASRAGEVMSHATIVSQGATQRQGKNQAESVSKKFSTAGVMRYNCGHELATVLSDRSQQQRMELDSAPRARSEIRRGPETYL